MKEKAFSTSGKLRSIGKEVQNRSHCLFIFLAIVAIAAGLCLIHAGTVLGGECEGSGAIISVTSLQGDAEFPSYDFGQVRVGSSCAAPFTIQNDTGAESLDIDSIALSGPHATEFSITTDGCTGASLAPSETCTIDITFTPATEGHKIATATVSFSTPGASPLTIPLEGGVRPLLVKDIHPGGNDSAITDRAEVNGTLFFAANDGTSGRELWKSNGTESGTVMVKDIYPGINGSAITDLTNVNGTLFFTANDGIHGLELWKSNGTKQGPVMVKDICPGSGGSDVTDLTNVNGTLFFTANDGIRGVELWKSDGTELGTVIIKDLDPGDGSSSPANLIDVNGFLLFTADDGTNGRELWKTDGTASGIVMVKDLCPDGSSLPRDLTYMDGLLLFTADDGTNGRELWKSDGTESGTVMVKDLNPGASSGNPANLTDMNGLLFFAANDGTSGRELWQSDGTESGTVMVKDIYPGSSGSAIANLADVNGTLFFAAWDATNRTELWKSDGTESGTVMVKDLNPGTGSGSPANLTNVNGLLLFTADNGTNGRELWESDGTEAGTVMLGDICPGSTGSSPAYLTNVNGTLYFNANDGSVGSELWRYVPDTPPAVSVIEDQDAWDNKIIGPISFTISDTQTLSDDLVVRVTSTNQTLLPDANITLGGSGDNRTITLTPALNQTGTTEVTVSVSDGYRTTRKTFTVEWWPALNVPSEYPTIQAAINDAVDGDIVLVADGVYTGAGNKNIDFGGKSITLRSENGPENTIIDCENNGRAFIFQSGKASPVILDGFTIRNGNESDGGAIYIDVNTLNTPIIKNCIFLNNYATSNGGAIFLGLDKSSGTQPFISNCSFSENKVDSSGGAIYILMVSAGNGFFEIANCSFLENSCYSSVARGGAICADYGFGCDEGDEEYKSVIRGSRFFYNIGGEGGAVSLVGCCAVTNCHFSNNTAIGNGGAIAAIETWGITNSTFWNNMAFDSGGAIAIGVDYCDYSTGEDIVHCSLWNNKALRDGGGIIVVSSRFVVTVLNSILWGNKAGDQGDQIYGGRYVVSHTNIEGGNFDLDPQFALEEDFHLMPDSPCIDAGTDSPAGGLPSTDLEGNIRSLDGNRDGSNAPDMGAYEFDRAVFPAAAISPNRFHFTAREGGALPEAQTLFIRSRGLGALNWRVREEISWLRLDTTEGSSTGEPDAVKLYVDHSDLTHGIYKGHLDIVDSNSSRTYRTVEITLHVTTTLHVPSVYATIQSAIDAAIDGDTVVVADGTYTGAGNMNLDFRGKELTVKSANGPEHTVIDCEDNGRAFYFHRGETAASVVQGFTITRGYVIGEGVDGSGGGILVTLNASPTILGCIFSDNEAEDSGGGIALLGSQTFVKNCSFDNNRAGVGGGLFVGGSHNSVDKCIFSHNSATRGGGIRSECNFLTVNDSKFTDNSASSGGGISSDGASISIMGSTFSYNKAESGTGGGVELLNRGRMTNCIFYDNSASSGGADVWVKNNKIFDVTNCTFTNTSTDGSRGEIFGPETIAVTNSILWNCTPVGGVTIPSDNNCTVDPLFIDETNGDFRLDPSSPCIDAGTMIPDLFSDLRGSVRPIDGDKYGSAEFDIGAFEYSEYYGGLPGDLTAKAFKDLEINASLVVTGFDYHIDWKDRDPFPFDPRIYHSEAYDVNVALVNEYGLRIDLGTHTVRVSQHGYSLPYTFGPEHIGTWRIRLELTSDPNQFVLSDEISIQYKETTRYALSQWIKPPEGADPSQKPDVDNPDTVYWSVETKRLYAIEPTTTVITWYTDEQREVPLPVVAYITYPDKEHYPGDPDTQIHIANSMPVDLLPEGTSFDLVEKMYANNDATISANQFTAGREGWAVLLYRDDQADNPDAKEKFDVVRTYVWNHSQDPDFPIELSWDIGKQLTDAAHCEECSNGYVFFEGARYDGYGESRAYERSTREGPIFPVNKDLTGPIVDDLLDPRDDLVVIWYKQSTASDVCWPSKPVRYNCKWPDEEPIDQEQLDKMGTIVIASEHGTGPLDPEIFGPMENMLVYAQADPARPGYNPNEEHADFFTAQGSEYPAVFPLRTDLNRPDTSDPYVLLKYMDPLRDTWSFKVYKVVAQSGSYVSQSGKVVPDDGTNSMRYYIDNTGILVQRSDALPEESYYYIDADGHLVNPADTVKTCYNYSDGSIGPVSCLPAVQVGKYYIDGNGQLKVQDSYLDEEDELQYKPLPTPSYYLDGHGVLVESDTYYRFHYTGVAGQEINPPYPLNQLTFGPCAESYTTTEEWVLDDKDDKFFAKNGGFNGKPTEKVVVNYFYRLQPGFYYDLDGDGFQDETVGTPIPWLDGLGGELDGEPVDTAYAIRWPDPVPTLFVGETLTDAKTQEGESVGLPNVKDQCIVHVLFDQSVEESGGRYDVNARPAVNIIDPLHEYAVDLPLGDPAKELPPSLKPKFSLGSQRYVFDALPQHLKVRLTYDPYSGDGVNKGQLKLKGTYTTGTGEPLLLLNALTERDVQTIKEILEKDGLEPNEQKFLDAVDDGKYGTGDLKDQGDAGLAYPYGEGYPALQYAEMKALTAGNAQGTGYVTLAFNNYEDCPAPTMLSVIKVGCLLYRGEIKVIESENPFEERVTLRHNGDFGGKSDDKWFQWMYVNADFSGIPEGPGDGHNWNPYQNIIPDALAEKQCEDDYEDACCEDVVYYKDPSGGITCNGPPTTDDMLYQGAVDITVVGSGQQLLSDKWFSVRYAGDDVCPDKLSQWTRPQLYEGWIKRVMKKINLFDQKVKDFHASDVNTLASMISLAGRRYEGEIALSDDPEYLQNLGIIEVYETLLNRGKGLTGGDGDYTDINKALLFAANRLADLYMLLGNEAYADAADPTIGFSTEDGLYGTEAPSIFCFQNQMDSLLEEELSLLRGRDDEGVQPFYNRLIWNFTLGDGEVAYKENYNITDQNQDGEVNEQDAMIQYPQGHGDAWGYYLSAVKKYYELLKMKDFTWIPQSEAILVDQTPVEVDYRDERKFAVAAAAKARAGAEIVSLTYHENYVEDPEGQWQGYKDMDTDRAWGVSGWASRAGQGAFFDWVVGNANLPSEDTVHEGIAKVDRMTVIELREIASQYTAIQAEVDKADVGLNPLGLAKNAVPFDIDPARIANGETHFEQAYAKAVQAMNNAIAVFNHANQSTQLLRRQQDTLADFKRNIENTEADFNNRLIEVFGYPYADDCGPGETYPTAYRETGPDLYHYMYVDPSELMGVDVPKVHQFPVTFKTIDVDAMGALQEDEQEVLFHVATDSRFGLIKPPEWQGRRKAPGEIQLARSDLLQARGRFEKALVEYDNLLGHIEKQAALIEAQHNLNKNEILILNTANNTQIALNAAIMVSRSLQLLYRKVAAIAVYEGNAIAESIPTIIGTIAGLAAGTIIDATSLARGAAKTIGVLISETMTGMADVASLGELGMQQAKEIVSAQTNIALTALRGGFAIQQQLLQLENLIRTEATLRYEIYNLAESLQQSAGRYLSALARGERLLQDRLRFRRQTAAQIQNYRYKDMTFRIFRNTALEKYRAQFDMAAQYVYLAAKAYDYETTLLDYNSMAGQAFLTDIVRQRTIGLIEGGQPLTGSGLADPMKRMWQNFQVIKPQLGFNNPQEETNRFSLRQELFRIKMDEGSNDTWQQVLEAHRVDDLWGIPEFKRYCRPFASEGIPQPGIVIPFSTTVTSGLNFFEWPLGGGDSYYSATNFATKVRSVGVWFSDYNSIHLAETPRIYLVPAGEDVLRTPSYYTKEVRTWHVVDQKLPVPFPIVESELERSTSWIPTVDTLFDEMFQVRRHSDFRAYHDSGYVNESEMTFDSRLVGRSVWNTRWLLIIPGQSLLYDPDEGLERFIHGPLVVGSYGERTGKGVSDMKLFFHTYAYSGN